MLATMLLLLSITLSYGEIGSSNKAVTEWNYDPNVRELSQLLQNGQKPLRYGIFQEHAHFKGIYWISKRKGARQCEIEWRKSDGIFLIQCYAKGLTNYTGYFVGSDGVLLAAFSAPKRVVWSKRIPFSGEEVYLSPFFYGSIRDKMCRDNYSLCGPIIGEHFRPEWEFRLFAEVASLLEDFRNKR